MDTLNGDTVVEVQRTALQDGTGEVESSQWCIDMLVTGRLVVGGRLIADNDQRHRLRNGERIIFGRAFVFRLVGACVSGNSTRIEQVIPGSPILQTRTQTRSGVMDAVVEEDIHEIIAESSLADTQTVAAIA